MMNLTSVPELLGGSDGTPPIRIPWTGNVRITSRVRRLIDTRTFQRLRRVRQLGTVNLVYPGASHTRFEHSLGTYEMARRLAWHLRLPGGHSRSLFCGTDTGSGETLAVGGQAGLSDRQVTLLLLAALLHDVGHYPFSHVVEEVAGDLGDQLSLTDVRHEERARDLILNDDDLCVAIVEDWGILPEDVVRVIDDSSIAQNNEERCLRQLLGGPINPDKLDYLGRDSQHVGVPYGHGIDYQRLLDAMVLLDTGELAVDHKGITAVETLLFASYMMYREVYWHHTSRAANAMLKLAIKRGHETGEVPFTAFSRMDDEEALEVLSRSRDDLVQQLTEALRGPGRRIYKRLLRIDLQPVGETTVPPRAYLYGRGETGGRYLSLEGRTPLSRWLRDVCGTGGTPEPDLDEFRALLSSGYQRRAGRDLQPHEVLFDGVGLQKTLSFNVPVLTAGGELQSAANPEISVLTASIAKNFRRQGLSLFIFSHPDTSDALIQALQ